MAKFNWNEITAEDVIKAIETFEDENPIYPEPRSTYLTYNGKKYSAKHIRGMAYKVHFGYEISKEDYAGGQETVRFFEKLGFDVQYTHKHINTHPKAQIQKKTGASNNEDDIKPTATDKEITSKISVPIKGVIEQKNALQLILNRLFDGDVVCEKTYPWLKTPTEIAEEYQGIYDALATYRCNRNFLKKNITLRCDFVCESQKIIIEYDERQHFSEARRISLLAYPEISLNFDKDLWIRVCQEIQAKDNQPIDRDEARAFYDSVRDIEAVKHGYTLVRIMHGQIDFQSDNAYEQLENLLKIKAKKKRMIKPRKRIMEKKTASVKIGLYLQTDELHGNMNVFENAMSLVKSSDIDILVLPEISFVPFDKEFQEADILIESDRQLLYDKTLVLSDKIGKAIIICNIDHFGTIMSIYANALARENETLCKEYIKHTKTDYSACEISNYQQIADYLFDPIIYKGIRIGMTICYDCNHSIFSRKYGQNGVDIIINCTGGDVVFNKWHKYNKVRAIENHCFTFVTMGGDGTRANPKNYVFGFTPEGKEMTPILLNGKDTGNRNVSGGIYVYDTADDDGVGEIDSSINQEETTNKYVDIYLPVNDIEAFIQKGQHLVDGIRVIKENDMNIVLCLVDGEKIMKPEKVLKLLYAKELKGIANKRYIIINRWGNVDVTFYETKLSEILKVRAMENYCAVILTSDNITKCYQCGNNRTSQVVKPENEQFGIDLKRTSGPESIWKNKQGMKACWRDNVEWLISTLED